MSDYRRIVSYIYRYENGAKSTNEGYVRLEIRDGQLKCTVHITSQSLRDALVKVYFYVRKGDSITGILLGEMSVSAGNGDFKETTKAADLMGSGAALEDTGGMILSYVPNLFYATEWDDRPVTKEDMEGVTGAEHADISAVEQSSDWDEPSEETAEGERPEEPAEAFGTKDIEPTAALRDLSVAEEYTDYSLEESAEGSAVSQELGSGEPETEWDGEYGDGSPLEESVEEAAAAGQTAQVEYYTYGQYGRLEPASAAARSAEYNMSQTNRQSRTEQQTQQGLQTNTGQPVNRERQLSPGQWETMQQGGNIRKSTCAQRIPSPADCSCPASEPERVLREEMPQSVCPAQPIPETQPPAQPMQSTQPVQPSAGPEQPVSAEAPPQNHTPEAEAGDRDALLCSLDEKPLARTLLDNFPKISPFQDTEIAECVRIVPQNIGLLPIDAWVLGSNSFLQHGFYNHKHLIFAKKYTRSGIMYLLGVPGYFTQRERNMARMFGFNNFKSAKMRPVQNGEFGYWYVPIVF